MKLSQEEIDRRFELAVDTHQEHLLSKTGGMYPFHPDSLKEAMAEMSEENTATLAAYADIAYAQTCTHEDMAKFGEYFLRVCVEYWTDAAQKEAFAIVQKNFDPDNCV